MTGCAAGGSHDRGVGDDAERRGATHEQDGQRSGADAGIASTPKRADEPALLTGDAEARPGSVVTPLSVVDNFHEIVPGVAFRSGQLSPSKLRYVIEKYGVRTVVNLRGENPNLDWYCREQQACEDAGVRMVNIPLSSQEPPPREIMLDLFDAFQNTDGPVLMHCQSGADRSGAGAALWRMIACGEPAGAALDEMSVKYGRMPWKSKRWEETIRTFRADRGWIETEYEPGGK